MSSLNKVLLIGRLGRDPELRYTASGQGVASLSLATDESYTAKDGQKVERTEWHRIVVWGKQAEFCGNYLHKGRLVFVEGKLETRKWTDKDGQEKYTTEINAHNVRALDKAPEASQHRTPQQGYQATQHHSPQQNYQQPESTFSNMDDAPF